MSGKTQRKPRECEICKKSYRPSYGEQRTCSRACGVILRRTVTGTLATPPPVAKPEARSAACAECGTTFITTSPQRLLCSDECRSIRNVRKVKEGYHDGRYKDNMLRNAHVRARRLRKAKQEGDHPDPQVVAERDQWTCGICRQPVPRTPDPVDRRWNASIDHVIPIARGGMDTYENVQLTHYHCNLSKGAKIQ